MNLLLISLIACKKPVAPEEVAPPGYADAPVETLPPATTTAPRTTALVRIHFAYDSATLDADARNSLMAASDLLRAHQDVRLEIEGHCDERGTTDYNLALGDRRARSIRDFLAAQGIAGSRLDAVSYGEERPLDAGSGEAAWAANRRGDFRVVEGGGLDGTTR